MITGDSTLLRRPVRERGVAVKQILKLSKRATALNFQRLSPVTRACGLRVVDPAFYARGGDSGVLTPATRVKSNKSNSVKD